MPGKSSLAWYRVRVECEHTPRCFGDWCQSLGPDVDTLLFNYVQGLSPILRYELTKHQPHTFAEAEERAVAVESAERVMRAPLPRIDGGLRGPRQQQQ